MKVSLHTTLHVNKYQRYLKYLIGVSMTNVQIGYGFPCILYAASF